MAFELPPLPYAYDALEPVIQHHVIQGLLEPAY